LKLFLKKAKKSQKARIRAGKRLKHINRTLFSAGHGLFLVKLRVLRLTQ